jgi:lipopolysaccharide O-acetyltransferase
MIIQKIKNHYSIIDYIRLFVALTKTKVYYPKQRIIRFPFILRGKRMIDLGSSLTTGVGCRLEAFEADGDKSIKLRMGKRVQLNDYVHISAIHSVNIGNDVLMASHVYISDNSHGSYKGYECDSDPKLPPIKRAYTVSPVIIGNCVWLGEGVIVLPGVTIGNGAIIGAHSVVTTDIPSNSIAVGSPAKVVKIFNQQTGHWQIVNHN